MTIYDWATYFVITVIFAAILMLIGFGFFAAIFGGAVGSVFAVKWWNAYQLKSKTE